jgi:hypothetical protein
LVLHHVATLASAWRVLARRGVTSFDDGLGLFGGLWLADRALLVDTLMPLRALRTLGALAAICALTALWAFAAVVGTVEASVAEAWVFPTLLALLVLAALVAAIIAPVVASLFPTIIAAFIAPIVVAAILVTRLCVGLRLLTGMARKVWNGRLLAHARIDAFAVALLARIVHVRALARAGAVPVDPLTALLHLLLAVGDDHSVVVLGMLQIVLGEDRVTGGLGISGEGDVLRRNICRRAPDLHVGAVRLEAARERVLPFAVMLTMATMAAIATTAAAAATPTAMLLTLPHRLPFFPRRVCACSGTPEPSNSGSNPSGLITRATTYDGLS